MAKKVRVVVPSIMKEALDNDVEYFGIPLGQIGNKIFDYYSNKKIEKEELKSEKGEIIQFNLTKNNEENSIQILREQNFQTDSDYLRNIFYNYLNNPRVGREKILFNDIYSLIEIALKEEKKLKIVYNDDKESRLINPYFIKISKVEGTTYVFSWCEKNSDYRNYKISRIKNISLGLNTIERKDVEYIKNIEKNFDPFLTFGHEITVKVTAIGEELLKKTAMNRPIILEKKELKDDVWAKEYRFQCNDKLAKVYFAQFFSEVEILEPQELRMWLKESFERGSSVYNKK